MIEPISMKWINTVKKDESWLKSGFVWKRLGDFYMLCFETFVYLLHFLFDGPKLIQKENIFMTFSSKQVQEHTNMHSEDREIRLT